VTASRFAVLLYNSFSTTLFTLISPKPAKKGLLLLRYVWINIHEGRWTAQCRPACRIV